MKELTAVVEHGQITLPPSVSWPDGSVVHVIWDEQWPPPSLEAEAWTADEVQADLQAATGRLFPT
jgi:hypothetical protein